MASLLFISGMHRSFTSAFAGAVTLLTENHARDFIGPAMSNPKGHFEPVSVVSMNTAMLSSRQRVWFDCRPMPLSDADMRRSEIDGLASLLREEFSSDGLQVIKDPRLSLLAPEWIAAARQAELRPHLVGMVRDPAESASSISRRDKLDFKYALAVWLRHMLDLERHSRDLPRIFVDARRFIADPVSVLHQVSATLELSWFRSPESARTDLTTFVDKTLCSPAQAQNCDLLHMANEVCALLLASDGQDTAAPLDRITKDFDALAPTLYAKMVLRELQQCLPARWDMDAMRARLAASEGALHQAETMIANLQIASQEAREL
jgi:hypothetical protein